MKIIILLLTILYLARLLFHSRILTRTINELLIVSSFERYKKRIIEKRKHVEDCDCINCQNTKHILPPLPNDHVINRWRKDELKKLYFEIGVYGSTSIELFCLTALFSVILLHL